MISSEKLEEAIHRLMKDPNDLESAIKILNSSVISHCYINAGRVDVVSRAIKCVLNYLNSPTNRRVTETRRENVTLKKELENKDKMIELMAYEIDRLDDGSVTYSGHENFIENIKQYFGKKAEEAK